MKFEFKKASRKKSKLRCLIAGLSGSGKTYSALKIASGLGKKIAFIDTERGSASLYSNLVDFDVLELPDFTVDNYISALNAAARAAYDVIIIDSITHAWDKIKEEAEKNNKAGNSWSGWSVGTPLYKRFIDAIVSSPCHIISCVRVKTEWALEDYEINGKIKKKPIRLGLSPEQKGNVEYEFTIAMTLDEAHNALIIKDRTGSFYGKIIEKPGEEFGKDLLDWLNSGQEIKKITDEQLKRFNELSIKLNISSENIKKGLEMKGIFNKEDMTEELANVWINAWEEKLKSTNVVAGGVNEYY